MNTQLSILESETDGLKSVHFYLIYEGSVIAKADVAYPYEEDAYLREAFVHKKYRGMGLWRQLYEIRCEWIVANCPVKSIKLFVSKDNPMKEVYERYGFKTYKYKGKIAKTKDGHLWMRIEYNPL